MSDEWFYASAIELRRLLDRLEHEDEITLKPGDDGVAAIIGTLQGISVLLGYARQIEQARPTLALLGTHPDQ